MARFYAVIQGNRGPATRMGSIASGMYAHVRGWNTGAAVEVYVNDEGNDEVAIYKTGGSNRPHQAELLAVFTANHLINHTSQKESE